MIRATTNGLRTRLQAARDWLATDRRWAIVAIVILALLVLGGDSGVDLAPIVLSALLVTIGVALVRSESPETTAHADDTSTPHPVRERRPGSKLPWLTLAATLSAVGIALVADAATGLSLEPGQFMALSLATIGCGLLVGGWWGRARLMIPVGLLLVPVVLVSSLIEGGLTGRIGDIGQMPLTPDDLPERMDVLAGGGMLDLTHLRLEGQDKVVDIDLGLGEIDVLLPQRFRTDVTVSLGAGSMWVLGQELDGTELEVSRTAHEELAEAGTLTLLIDAGAGSVSVDQAWEPPARDDRRKKATERAENRRDRREVVEKSNRRARDRRRDR